jgi:hypothetical protein
MSELEYDDEENYEDNEDIENEDNNDTSKSSSKKKKKKKNKRIELELSDQDYEILETDFDKLRELVINTINYKITEIETTIDEINADESIENKKALKKNLIAKLRKFKKDLTNEEVIKKRTKILGIRKRKLSKIAGKVQEKIEKVKKQKLRCFKCRKRGHTVSECTHVEKETHLCYNCGSKEHNIYGCTKKVDYNNLPFAECFICNKKGHISSKCPTSDKGIYIRGGSCFICEGKDHLAKNCPQKQINEVIEPKEEKLLKKKRMNK